FQLLNNWETSVGKKTAFKVKDTAWTVSYWHDGSLDLTLIGQILGIILIPVFISGLACYFGYRKLNALLVADQSSVLKATKDILSNQAGVSYPVRLRVWGLLFPLLFSLNVKMISLILKII
ncbi:hypothetical protein BMR07_18035, partial [Methylococcaceae bacterium CS1]